MESIKIYIAPEVYFYIDQLQKKKPDYKEKKSEERLKSLWKRIGKK